MFCFCIYTFINLLFYLFFYHFYKLFDTAFAKVFIISKKSEQNRKKILFVSRNTAEAENYMIVNLNVQLSKKFRFKESKLDFLVP